MKQSYRLLAVLLVLPFLAGTNSFADNSAIASVPSPGAFDVPVLSVVSPSGNTIEFYQSDLGWEAVSAEQLAALSDEVNTIPESILDQINTSPLLEGAAGEPGWTCEVVKHTNGPWTWNCWRDY